MEGQREGKQVSVPTYAAIFCGIALLVNLVFLIRLDNRTERFLDYGEFRGKYESESTVIRRELDKLSNELLTERAWKVSIKTDLSELLALERDVRMRRVIDRMITTGSAK